MAPFQTILIVGGGQGIGFETTKAILSLSSSTRIVIFGLHTDPELEYLSKVFSNRLSIVIGDVTNTSDRGKAVETCAKTLGGIDTLVYTAGIITPIQRIENVDIEALRKIYDINVFGAIAMVGLSTLQVVRNGANWVPEPTVHSLPPQIRLCEPHQCCVGKGYNTILCLRWRCYL